MIRTAVVPAAGLGTRLAPATRTVPKEMLPLGDRPVLHHVLEEAVAAGLEDLVVVTGRHGRIVREYFDGTVLPREARVRFVRQERPEGLGHAVLLARPHTGADPFCVLLGDSVVTPPGGADLARLLAAHEETGDPTLALEPVPAEETARRGVVRPARREMRPRPGERVRITGLVEKPDPAEAPSGWCVAARYVLTPEIYPILEALEPGLDGELQLTDALDELARRRPVHGIVIQGRRHDVGNPPDYARALLAFALDHPETGPAAREELRERGWRPPD